jgi:hypothetical protein
MRPGPRTPRGGNSTPGSGTGEAVAPRPSHEGGAQPREAVLVRSGPRPPCRGARPRRAAPTRTASARRRARGIEENIHMFLKEEKKNNHVRFWQLAYRTCRLLEECATSWDSRTGPRGPPAPAQATPLVSLSKCGFSFSFSF